MDQETGRSFVGTIAKRRHAYVLKAADGEYLLNDSAEAKQYKGKRVKVTGSSNENCPASVGNGESVRPLR